MRAESDSERTDKHFSKLGVVDTNTEQPFSASKNAFPHNQVTNNKEYLFLHDLFHHHKQYQRVEDTD